MNAAEYRHSEDSSIARRADLLRRTFPDVRFRTIHEMPHSGWGGDSDVLLADGHLIFRLPRSEDSARALAVEVGLLPELASRVSVPIPRFLHVAWDAQAGLPRGVGYEAIRGEPLRGDDLRRVVATVPVTAERLAGQLGRFLAGLHGFPVERAMELGVPRPELGSREQVELQYRRAQTDVYPALASDERAWLTRRFETYLADDRHFTMERCLCHGDLTSDHILYDADRGELAGIIDFGDLVIGDRAGDFVWRYEYGDRLYRQVLAHYSPPIADPDAFDEMVAFRYDLMPTIEIAYGLATGNPAYVEEGRRDLRARMQR